MKHINRRQQNPYRTAEYTPIDEDYTRYRAGKKPAYQILDTARRRYGLVRDELGDAVKEYEVVTVRDVMRMLPRAEAERYIEEGEEFVRYEVREK